MTDYAIVKMTYPISHKPWCVMEFTTKHPDGRICLRFATEDEAKANLFDKMFQGAEAYYD